MNLRERIMRFFRRFGFAVACALSVVMLLWLYNNANELSSTRTGHSAGPEDGATASPAALHDLPPPRPTTLSVVTDPPNATVFIDGDSVGVSPLKGHRLNSGMHLLSIEKQDFPAVDSILVLGVDPFTISISLREGGSGGLAAEEDTDAAPETPAPAADDEATNEPADLPVASYDAQPPALPAVPIPEESTETSSLAILDDLLAMNGPRKIDLSYTWQDDVLDVFAPEGLHVAATLPVPSASYAEETGPAPDEPAPAPSMDHALLPEIARAEETDARPSPEESKTEEEPVRPSDASRSTTRRAPAPSLAEPEPRRALPAAAAPEIKVGEVRITSDPPGASVWLNDRQLGTTPLRVRQVEAVEQQVTLRLDGYAEYRTSVFVRPRQTNLVEGQLTLLPETRLPVAPAAWETGPYTGPFHRMAKGRKAKITADVYGKRTLRVGEVENFRVRRIDDTVQPVEYYWDFGDGTLAEGNNVAHRFRRPGRYTVNVIVRNAGGVDTDTLRITVTGAPPPPPAETTVTLERPPVRSAVRTPEARAERETPARIQPAARNASLDVSLYAPERLAWPRSGYTWVVVTHFHRESAEADARRYREEGYRTGVFLDDKGPGSPVYRIAIGHFSTQEAALEARSLLPPDIPGSAWLFDLSDAAVE